jgi:hypothetical protein
MMRAWLADHEPGSFSFTGLVDPSDATVITPDYERFFSAVEAAGSAIAHLDPDIAFGQKSGDVGDLTLAGAVMLGQLGTSSDTVRYGLILADESGQPFNGDGTYPITVPAGVVHEGGYFSVTVYGSDNKLLIPNDRGVYDQTTYSATPAADGSYTITLSPSDAATFDAASQAGRVDGDSQAGARRTCCRVQCGSQGGPIRRSKQVPVSTVATHLDVANVGDELG